MNLFITSEKKKKEKERKSLKSSSINSQFHCHSTLPSFNPIVLPILIAIILQVLVI